jgi:hypothetical protein
MVTVMVKPEIDMNSGSVLIVCNVGLVLQTCLRCACI